MNKYLLFTFALVISHTSLMAQRVVDEFVVTGKIIEKQTQQPLEYATIAFFSKTENKIIGGGITDPQGNFSISISKGVYDISFEYFSFKTISKLNFNLNQTINLGVISLEEDLQALDAVDLIAEKTTVEIKLDKKIYNVGKDLTVRGGTVSDVLNNVPSVSVDIEGNVALRGNENVRILINGKPSGLVGLNASDALRQLPAEAIAKVEVITSPSARYDAEGTAGILNIILRRSKLLGLNGAVILNAGHPDQLGAIHTEITLEIRPPKQNILTPNLMPMGFLFKTIQIHFGMNTERLNAFEKGLTPTQESNGISTQRRP